jgi:outer membrane receptor for ferrienterochelin and colicin
MSLRIPSLLLLLLLCLRATAQDTTYFKTGTPEKRKARHTVSGFITDKISGERLIGAIVFDKASNLGTITNSFGFFSLTLPEGQASLRVSYVGYQPQNLVLDLSGNISHSFAMATATELGEVEIVADREEAIEKKTQMSSITIPVDQIKSLPRFMGEVDVLKALQLLPGVQGGTEGTSGFYVRGGSPDQNLILLDGVPIYNANHLFGFFSVFNGEALNNVTLIKGGFPARYGGRLSSVVDLTTKDGNQNKVKGNINVGLISSSVSLEGPVIKGKSTFVVAARRTYIDLLAQPIIKAASNGQGTAGYYFYDMNAKYTHKLGEKTKMYVSFYGGNDKFYARFKETSSNKGKAGLGWGNIAAVLRLNHQYSPRLFANYCAIFSRYKFNSEFESVLEKGTPTESRYYANYFSSIRDFTVKAEYDYFISPTQTLRFGGNATTHLFNPGALAFKAREEGQTIIDTTSGLKPRPAQESYLFAENEFSAGSRLRFNLGLHYSSFFVDHTSYHSLQPRISARLSLTQKVSLKASYAKMAQYIHLLTNAGLGLPTDLWVPSTAKVKPQQADQFAIGAATTFGDGYEFSIEAYHKTMHNIIEYKDGESYLNSGKIYEDKVTAGKGYSYGSEFFLQKKAGKFTGWIGYTLAWSKRSFREINNGELFPYRYDRRHDISVVLNHKFNDRIALSVVWVYGTGNAITLAQQYIPGGGAAGNYQEYYSYYGGKRNSFRMGPYHRADINLSFTKQKAKGTRTWNLSVYNVYNHQNPFFIQSETNYQTGRTGYTQYSLFPIIPSISYTYAF